MKVKVKRQGKFLLHGALRRLCVIQFLWTNIASWAVSDMFHALGVGVLALKSQLEKALTLRIFETSARCRR